MRELTHNELSLVSAGDLTCSISLGSSGVSISCTGSTSDWKQLFNDAADAIADAWNSLWE